MVLVATILSTSAIMITAQSQMQALNNQFNDITNQTTNFLGKAWNIAQKFQNPDYNYDPSELGNYTLPELGNYTLPELGNYTTTEIPSAANSG
jgi:hypothetical protein